MFFDLYEIPHVQLQIKWIKHKYPYQIPNF